MLYQICNKEGQVLDGTAKYPFWSTNSLKAWKRNGIGSFIKALVRYSPGTNPGEVKIDGKDVRLDELRVCEMEIILHDFDSINAFYH